MKEYQILSIIQRHYFSPTGLQEELAKHCKYKSLPPHLSDLAREIYRKNIPENLNINGEYDSLHSTLEVLIWITILMNLVILNF